jgi:hypothetical protein
VVLKRARQRDKSFFRDGHIGYTVKRIQNLKNSKRGRYYAQIIRTGKLEARLFFFLNFKETQSQEEQKTIFSGLPICKMALSDQIDFPAIFRLRKMTYWNFINSGIRQSAVALTP